MDTSPTKMPQSENFVTVVSVGEEQFIECPDSALKNDSTYVTVLTIGNTDDSSSKNVTEEVLVYRLPGERLGFGLKFEGGTKASEFVKRLFIQSCAADSPASRVKSSWGSLVEGDEVLEIDGIPVNTMTRIDCVRCLKDSNVVINLLVRHFTETENKLKTRSVEDLPQVISAEKKRTPPPPPPVPPRKIPRKLFKHHNPGVINQTPKEPQESQEIVPVPVIRQSLEVNGTTSKVKKFQSPRSSGRLSYSPDVSRRDRRFSDGSLGPPDAEVYVDLISQESTQSLSESDDTGSTISTVIDRLGSFPTTTTSSFAGSLPSTPTAVQKQLDLTNLFNNYDETIVSQNVAINKVEENEKTNSNPTNDEGAPLQPPSCFQDAPLSYGNEDMRIISEDLEINNKKDEVEESKVSKKPPVPPRTKDINGHINLEANKDNKSIHDENMNIPSLPRLVDFVPKTLKENIDNPIEVMKLFLENERRGIECMECESDDADNLGMYNSGIDLYTSKWGLSPPLATIGEVEEEREGHEFQFNRSVAKPTPIVIVENADCDKNEKSETHSEALKEVTTNEDTDVNMETLPSDSRQPPDGHEFPDYKEETKAESPLTQLIRKNYHLPYNLAEEDFCRVEPVKTYRSVEDISISHLHSSSDDFVMYRNPPNKYYHNKDSSNSNDEDSRLLELKISKPLHTRSQSLTDVTDFSQKQDKWRLISEHRKKNFSKLKGLVIPENDSENEVTPAICLPEIRSVPPKLPVFEDLKKTESHFIVDETKTTSQINSEKPTLKSPPWLQNNHGTLPKYSPAFKRKSLEVYTPTKKIDDESGKQQITEKTNNIKLDNEDYRLYGYLSDPPKSLESITSPTRSDCSFDYNSIKRKPEIVKPHKESPHYQIKGFGKSEDESDNDSAVSSSQSSFLSSCSPAPSSCDMNDYDTVRIYDVPSKTDEEEKNSLQSRLLKASSVEAINRKNILASAKCRSGRDLKVGSPVIHRKYDENEERVKNAQKINTNTLNSGTLHHPVKELEQRIDDAKSKSETQKVEITISKPVITNGYPVKNSEIGYAVVPEKKEISRPTTNPPPPPLIDQKPLEKTVVNNVSPRYSSNLNLKPSQTDKILTNKKMAVDKICPNEIKSLKTIGKSLSGELDLTTRPINLKTVTKPPLSCSKLSKSVENLFPGNTKLSKTVEPFSQSNLKPVDISRGKFMFTDNSKYKSELSRSSSNLYGRTQKISVNDLRKNFESLGSAPITPALKPLVDVKSVTTKIDFKSEKVKSNLVVTRKSVAPTQEKVNQVKTVFNETKTMTVRKSSISVDQGDKLLKGRTVKLSLSPGRGHGVTLAGGIDLETKTIRVYKIRKGSIAEESGAIKRGDVVLSVNGKNLKNLTHNEIVQVMKEPVEELTLVIEDIRNVPLSPVLKRKSSIASNLPETQTTTIETQPEKRATHIFGVKNSEMGLGLSIEGGKNSSDGDVPIRIKKIFRGGAAEKAGELVAGDEIVAVNGVSITNMSSIEAWTFMKAEPGVVNFHICR